MITMNNIKIGSTLKQIRKSKNLSIDDVANFFIKNNILISNKTIYGWENDFSYPPLNKFLLLCQIYNINDISIFTKS
jgi:transcriptional regulator with XRE-family HTH domain